MLELVRNPDLYHGKEKVKNFFEGWYFKIVDKSKKHVLAFIPGIIKSENNKDTHAFIQVLNGKRGHFEYLEYNEQNFKWNNDVNNFNFSIGDNYFSYSKMIININDEDIIKGTLKFSNILKWPDSKINPGSMGFYNYLSFMECYSQVGVVDGKIEGSLSINGEEINFTDGKIYSEKKWGVKFPTTWIWAQGNCFEQDDVSVTCSIAKIPFLKTSFTGFLVGLNIGDEFYKFTTINRSKINIINKGTDYKMQFRKDKLLLEIDLYTNKKDFFLCKAPIDGTMRSFVSENINSIVTLRLFDENNNNIIYEGKSYCSGVEYCGNIDDLI